MRIMTFLEHSSNRLSSEEIIDYIKTVSDNPVTTIPHHFLTLIEREGRDFELRRLSIENLLESDPDLREYVENDEDRYEEEDYVPHYSEIDNPIVILNGEVIDGYNRTLVKYQSREEFIDAYVSI
jgi:glutaredoxin